MFLFAIAANSKTPRLTPTVLNPDFAVGIVARHSEAQETLAKQALQQDF